MNFPQKLVANNQIGTTQASLTNLQPSDPNKKRQMIFNQDPKKAGPPQELEQITKEYNNMFEKEQDLKELTTKKVLQFPAPKTEEKPAINFTITKSDVFE